MPDIYDAEIERLKDATWDEIYAAWEDVEPLFAFLGNVSDCGCPTMVKGGEPAETQEVEDFVKNDPGIPDDPDEITPAMLPAFAEVQRFADAHLPSRRKAVTK